MPCLPQSKAQRAQTVTITVHQAINTSRKLTTATTSKKVFAQFGVDATKYDALADSKSTGEKLALWRTQQNEFKIDSVPAFIVNDKYAVNLNSIKTLDELIGLINYLAIEKDAAAAKTSSGGSIGWLFLVFAAAIGVTRQQRLS